MTRRPSLDAGAPPSAADAIAAVDAIIANFGAHRRDEYFAGFAPEATFVFHSVAERLESRDEYEQLWQTWEQLEGFRVESCVSRNRRIELFGNTAVFSHDVETTARQAGSTGTIHERETIIMRLIDGTWLGVHEHLSLGTAP